MDGRWSQFQNGFRVGVDGYWWSVRPGLCGGRRTEREMVMDKDQTADGVHGCRFTVHSERPYLGRL